MKPRSEDPISFTDDTSPNMQNTRKRQVSINATVIKEKRLDWYYELIRLFPGIGDELKSTVVLQSYRYLSMDQRQKIWMTLKDVHIHITDALPKS